jgi:hypothetical protein
VINITFIFQIPDDEILRNLLTKQITHLSIDTPKALDYTSRILPKIFGLILFLCKRLTVLNICNVFLTRNWQIDIFDIRESLISSTLIKLSINVTNFVECLFLLDGRLDSLSTLIINVNKIFNPFKEIGGRVSRIPMIHLGEKLLTK